MTVHNSFCTTAFMYGMYASYCSVGANWNTDTWHLRDRLFVVEEEDNDDLVLIKRISISDSDYDGDGYNDQLIELARESNDKAGIRALMAIAEWVDYPYITKLFKAQVCDWLTYELTKYFKDPDNLQELRRLIYNSSPALITMTKATLVRTIEKYGLTEKAIADGIIEKNEGL